MYRALPCLSLTCLLFCVPVAEGKDYAVLISAGEATTDDAPVNSCFWYNPYLQYMTLLDEGYAADDIHFLYGWGADFASIHPCYQPPEPVTDYAVNRANIQSVFSMLADVMTADDFLYVWWMGHGWPSGGNLAMNIGTTGQTVYDYEMETWVGQITAYDVRTFSWMTCHSGGILDNFEEPQSIVMSSATFYESTYDQWQCDTWHAEFHYPERCAWAWETPCGICGPVDADSNGNGRVSFEEAFTYAEANTTMSHPQMSDVGGLAPTTYLSTETGGVVYEYQDDFSTKKAMKDSYDHSIFWPEEAFPPPEPYLFYTRHVPPPGGLGFADYKGKPAHLAYRFPIIQVSSVDAPYQWEGMMELEVFFGGDLHGELSYSVSPDGKIWSYPLPLAEGHQKFELVCGQAPGSRCYVRLLGHDAVIDNLHVLLKAE